MRIQLGKPYRPLTANFGRRDESRPLEISISHFALVPCRCRYQSHWPRKQKRSIYRLEPQATWAELADETESPTAMATTDTFIAPSPCRLSLRQRFLQRTHLVCATPDSGRARRNYSGRPGCAALTPKKWPAEAGEFRRLGLRQGNGPSCNESNRHRFHYLLAILSLSPLNAGC